MLRTLVTLLVAVHAIPQVLTTLSVVNGAASVAAESGAMFAARSNKMPTFEDNQDGADVDFEYDLELDLDVHSKRKVQRLHPRDDTRQKGLFSVVEQGTMMSYGRGKGYQTTQAVQHGDVLFSMPMSDVMSLASARAGRIGVLLEANPTLPPAIALALHVLEEKCLGVESKFYTFIQSMPSSMEINSTMFYSESDLELLKGSNLFRLTTGRVEAIQNFYDALLTPLTSLAVDPPLFSVDDFTFQNFKWAMGIVWSYAFPLSASEESVVLAPILSTIGICTDKSTCPTTNGVMFDTSEQRLVVHATQDYAMGQQVRLPFGDISKSTTLLMLNHGFAPLKPLVDVESFEISILLDTADLLVSVKTHVLETHNMSMNGTYTLRYKSESLDKDMVKSLKIKLLTGAELDKFHELVASNHTRDEENEDKADGNVVSLRNEFVFTRAILLSCRRLLSQYPTTLKEDQNALQARIEADSTNGMMDRSVHILRALIVEKEILQHTIDLVTKQWTDLLMSDHPNIVQG